MQTVRVLTWNNRNTQFIKTITTICSVSNVTSPAPLWHHVILLMSTAEPLATFNLERFNILNVKIDTRTQNEALKMYNTSIFQTVLFEPKEIVLWRHPQTSSIQHPAGNCADWILMKNTICISIYIYIYTNLWLLLYIDIYIYISFLISTALLLKRCLFFTITWKRFLVFFWIYARVGFFRAKKTYLFHLWDMPSVAFELDCPLVSHCLPTNCEISLVVLRATVAT